MWTIKRKKKEKKKRKGREVTVVLEKNFRGAAAHGLKVGDRLVGYANDASVRPVLFDGSYPHATMEFLGNRYAIMCFTGKDADKVDENAKEELESMVLVRAERQKRREYRQSKADRDCLEDARNFMWCRKCKNDTCEKIDQTAEDNDHWVISKRGGVNGVAWCTICGSCATEEHLRSHTRRHIRSQAESPKLVFCCFLFCKYHF